LLSTSISTGGVATPSTLTITDPPRTPPMPLTVTVKVAPAPTACPLNAGETTAGRAGFARLASSGAASTSICGRPLGPVGAVVDRSGTDVDASRVSRSATRPPAVSLVPA